MSSNGPQNHFSDILEAIQVIQEYVAERDFHQYQADLRTKWAIERKMGILSEAAIRLGEQAEHLCPGPDWRNIRGLGSVLRHEYDKLIDRILWEAIQTKLPPLRQDVLRALGKLTGHSSEPNS